MVAMDKLLYPDRAVWPELIKRPELPVMELNDIVNQVFSDVRNDGDEALLRYSEKFDSVTLQSLRVDEKSIMESEDTVDNLLLEAINLARQNIEKFHKAQSEKVNMIETSEGVRCWRENRPIDKVGLYIPGGTAPLFSTVLMLAIPARLAGCKEIILCTPPDKNGKIHPAILYAAKVTGVTAVFNVGGIQAVAAMTFGTPTIPPVFKIFGPGNRYVTAAKQKAFEFGVAIDMPAGPSEVLIITDSTGNPDFIAADLLSQAEHGTDSQVMLLCDDDIIINRVLSSVEQQLKLLPRRETAAKALGNSRAIVMKTLDDCISFSNMYAPEHLIAAVSDCQKLAGKVTSAGSVFLGQYSCESAGDYASGTNHTLPTNGFARNYSGVSVDSFVKKITFQEITKKGLSNIGPAIITMAEAEGLKAHANAVSIRLK